jgi:hypothetical protein
MAIKVSNNKSLRILLHGPSQDADPWYCIRCWERVTKSTTAIPFEETSVSEQALRLGVDPTLRKVNETALRKRYKDYAKGMRAAIGHDKLAYSILNNSPRAYPTPKAMDDEARLNLQCAGRRFEIAQLCFDIKTCDCCGVTRPYDVDPWCGKNATTGQTAVGSHLRRGYYSAHKYVTNKLFYVRSIVLQLRSDV